ncbi:aldo/keto reductase [Dongia sp.]|uniref:aldo/keto reductase n=1 Tax=Dongia sp. TaxID=1977262 RepID=UPI0035B01BA1
MKTRSFKAPSGAKIDFTELGFGTAPLGNLYRALSETEAQATLQAAWDAGLRYIDTAPLYGLGLSETRINHFLRGKPRDSYVLSTKVGRLLEVCAPDQRTGICKFFETPTRREIYDYGHDGIMRSVEASLERLGIDRIDILFVHDIDVFNHKSVAARDEKVTELMKSGYGALVKLRDQGVIKAFGAGVNEWEVCEILAKQGDFDLFLLAGRYTLLEQESLSSFLPLCEKRGIGIVIGGAYNSGILASGAKPGAFYNYDPAPQHILDRVAGIEKICARHGVKLVEAALRFPLVHPAVVTVIPGASRPEEVALNMQALAADIPAALWAELKAEGFIRRDAPVPGGK